MIQVVVVTNDAGESLAMELANPEESGFAIRKITGLGPVKSDIRMTSIAAADGSRYNSSRMPYRNIVFTISPEWKPTIEASRLRLYRYFPIKRRVNIRFVTDMLDCEIFGYVEKIEPDIFSKDETISVSVICPDPYFREVSLDPLAHVISLSSVTPLFEVNPSADFIDSFAQTSFETSLIIQDKVGVIDYNGDSDAGVEIRIHATAPVFNPVIYNETQNKIVKLNYTLQTSDEVVITSVVGAKSAFLYRNGERYNILNYMQRPFNWLTLTKGPNVFSIHADSNTEDNMLITISYEVLYGGI